MSGWADEWVDGRMRRASGRSGGRAGERAHGWTDTTWPVVKCIALNFMSVGRAHRAIQSGVKYRNITDGHLTTQTSRRTNIHIDTYIQSPDEQTGLTFL